MKKVKNTEGISLYEALRFRGYNPECKKIEGVLKYFELHIEQGRILEDEGLKIGIINSIAAATRYWLTIDGRQDHSGATPMGMRQDALCAAGEIIIELENIAKRESIHSSVGTVGYLGNYPNAFNVVPGKVKMGLDIRGVEKDSIDRIDDEIVKFVDEVCKKRNLNYELDNISKAIPVKLDEDLKNELSDVATKLGIKHKIMNSGAGHDAMKFWDIAPTGMVFIPCKDGVSHNKAEEIEYEDIILGSKIIFEELKQLNSRR